MDNNMFAENAGRGIASVLHQECNLRMGKDYAIRGNNSNRTITFGLHGVGTSHLDRITKAQAKLTMAVGLPNNRLVRVAFDNRLIQLEVSKPQDLWSPVTIDGMMKHNLITPGARAVLGLDTANQPAMIDFADKITASVSVAGESGSGKSNTMKNILWNIAHNNTPAEAKILILDPSKKGQDWLDVANIPHLIHPIVTDFEEARQICYWLEQEYRRRTLHGITAPRLYVFIDELRDLCRNYEDILERLNLVASLGRSFGMHIIWATQYPKLKQLGTKADELKDNSNITLVGRVSNAANAANALGIPDSGAEMLTGRGDFFMRQPEVSGLTRLVVALLMPKHLALLERVVSVPRLQLPLLEEANNAVSNDYLSPRNVMVAYETQAGMGKLKAWLGIGSDKAGKLQAFAKSMAEAAKEAGPWGNRK